MRGIVKEFKIIDGPDRTTLFSALQYEHDDNIELHARFHCKEVSNRDDDQDITVLSPILHGIRHDCNALCTSSPDAGKKFIISGFCLATAVGFSDMDYIGFEARYNTETHEGTMVFNSTAVLQKCI